MSAAPGAPGISPTWSSSAKDMVGCGLDWSRLWFTIGHGIINEVYYPRVDIPQIRDLGGWVDFTYRSGTQWVGRDFRVVAVPRTQQLA